MPRLLLVDDNPSIHKIAETLLATSSIELVCVDSAAAALERIDRGERFDVALVDISMAGMDGWGLMARFRELPATARMPIAMMAGVLDTVDPERIKEAPIQGFLKKPVELRDLGDRVARLLEVPMPLPAPEPLPTRGASPFATMPATPLDELPELRQETPESDVLVLTEEDLVPAPAEPAEESLDLEELDLEGLQTLSHPPAAAPSPEEAAASAPTPQEDTWPEVIPDAVSTLDRLPDVPELLPEIAEFAQPAQEIELPDLGVSADAIVDITSLDNLPEIEGMGFEVPAPEAEAASPSFTPPLPPLEESLDWSDDSDSLLSSVAALEANAPAAPSAAPIQEEELDLLDVPGGEPEPLFHVEEPPAAEPASLAAPDRGETPARPAADLQPAPVPGAAPAGVKDFVEALKADPALMDVLAKAVAARLGDQVLREVAWEVMPELAERLPRG